jgi:Acid Phosphatase
MPTFSVHVWRCRVQTCFLRQQPAWPNMAVTIVLCAHKQPSPVRCSECAGKPPALYPQAKAVLRALQDSGVALAVASRSPTPDIARQFLEHHDMTGMFAQLEIYPSFANNKQRHLEHLRGCGTSEYREMVFFDGACAMSANRTCLS